MVQRFEEYIWKYTQEQSGVLKKYLLDAFESKDQNLRYLADSLGTPVPSTDVRNCELLAGAGLLREEMELNRDGRNRYKIFYLTDLGKKMAQQIKEESKIETPEYDEVIASENEPV